MAAAVEGVEDMVPENGQFPIAADEDTPGAGTPGQPGRAGAGRATGPRGGLRRAKGPFGKGRRGSSGPGVAAAGRGAASGPGPPRSVPRSVMTQEPPTPAVRSGKALVEYVGVDALEFGPGVDPEFVGEMAAGLLVEP